MKFFNLFLLSCLLAFTACDTSTEGDGDHSEPLDTAGTTSPDGAMEKDGIRLIPADNSIKFNDASLSMKKPGKDTTLSAGKVQFVFDVENYDLGVQTPDANQKMIANSDKGQHIHLIIDNDPYSAHYDTAFTKEMTPGNHVVLAFLSRSYHESVKNDHSFVLRKINVQGDTSAAGESYADLDLSKPHLFYSRPKGDYSGPKETGKVLLDFFLINTDLSEGGNRVKATINGTEFTINRWIPYYIEGLPMGENTIRLELLDKNGNRIESPFNPVERKINLKEAAAK